MKLTIYTIVCWKYYAKNQWNTMILASRRHPHPSSGANRNSDIAVTENFHAEFNLMAVDPIMECF
jgi:hypothetical protein